MRRLQIPKIWKYSICAMSVFLVLVFVSAGNAQLTDSEDKSNLIQMIVDKWQDTSEETSSTRWEQGIRIWLQRLESDQLESALAAASYEEFTGILNQAKPSSATAQGIDPPLHLGKTYFALEPCRIVDTRDATGIYSGPISSGTIANYHTRDSAGSAVFVAQGGKAGGCGVPDNAEAVVVNITSTQQGGRGHLRAYPWGVSMPLAAILNFSGNTIGNSTILPICTTTCSYDFSIYASRSTHVVVDVMGYFAN